MRIYLTGGNRIQAFSNVFVDRPLSNPVIGRNFVISSGFMHVENADEDCRSFFDQICVLLERVGSFIWYVEFRIFYDNVSCGTLYMGLQQSVRLLPNVRSIIIEGRVKETHNDDEILQSRQMMKDNTFPVIPSVETMRVDVIRMPLEMKACILNPYGLQLKKICTDSEQLRNQLNILNFCFLSELVLNNIDNIDELSNLLRQMTVSSIPLQKFDGFFSVSCSVYDVLTALREINVKVVRLFRDFDNSALEWATYLVGEKDYSLKNTSIHTFQIEDSELLTYEFLQLLPNLEFLHINDHISFVIREVIDYVEWNYTNVIKNCVYFYVKPPAEFWQEFKFLREIFALRDSVDVFCGDLRSGDVRISRYMGI